MQQREGLRLVRQALRQATMIEKIIVVAPTTAVPMSTGLAVALKVLPAPSFSSRQILRTVELRRAEFEILDLFDVRGVSMTDSSKHRLGVVGHRTIRVDRDRHRTHATGSRRPPDRRRTPAGAGISESRP